MIEKNIEEKFDSQGRVIARIYGQDPNHPQSWVD